MNSQASVAQVFAVCVLSAAVESVTGADEFGVRAVCGVSIALAVMRAALCLLG